MLKLKSSKYIWIIGVPRSGTTFLTDYLGKFTDLCYNEPWGQYDIDNPNKWQFPNNKNIVFKYCANWRNADILNYKFKKSYFIHLIRHPEQVIHSMVFPKKDTIPYRNFFSTNKIEERFYLSLLKWKEFLLASRKVCKKYNGIEVVYEKLNRELNFIKNFIKLPLYNIELTYRPTETLELEKYWRLNKYIEFLEIRNQIQKEFYEKSDNNGN